MATEADMATLESRIRILEGVIAGLEARVLAEPGTQCSAEMPHSDMAFNRGPNTYLCRCGMKYAKNGPVLRKV